MDKLSIFALALAAGAVLGGQWLEGGSLGSLLQPAASLIVLGGTLAAVMLQCPLATFVRGAALVRWVVLPPGSSAQRDIADIVAWAGEVRRDGMLVLENRLGDTADPFVRNGLQMLVDGFEPERIREALDIEIAAWDERHRAAAKVWEAAGGYAPTIGILGAVLGLIHVMENLSDPARLGGGIAVAFVATVYGVGSANLLFLPIAHKLRTLIEREVTRRELLQDGLLGIANGENPRLIEARLSGYLA